MNREIRYNRIVNSNAGNKYPNQIGLLLERIGDDVIEIKAFNPVKLKPTTNLYMQIPLEHVQEVIDKLRELL